jgi:PAS domain-containing protein
VLTLEDITERKRAESLLALEYTVARLLANSASESAAVGGVIRAVCQNRGWDCGRYFRRDPLTGMLCCSDSWGQATPAVEQFLEKSRGLVLRPDVGLTGRVFGSGQPLWVRDGSQDPSLALAALAPETGREGAFVFAVTNEDQTIGVLAFSGTNVHEPDHRKLQAVHSIGSQLGRFLHQQAALDILRRTATRSRKLAELGSDWTWELDRNLRLTQLVGSNPFGTIPVLGRAFWQLPGVVPSDAQWAEHKSQLAARWSFCDFEFAVVRPDGELGHFCLCGEPLFDDAGTFTGYCGTARDITHRKRTQLASRHGPDNTLAL